MYQKQQIWFYSSSKHSLIKYIVDLFADVRPQSQEFPVYPVKCGFQEISLPGILAVEQFQQLDDELLVNTPFSGTRCEVWRLEEPQEKLVH